MIGESISWNKCTNSNGVKNPPGERRKKNTPVVRYALERRIETQIDPDFWDYTVLLELVVLSSDKLEINNLLPRVISFS